MFKKVTLRISFIRKVKKKNPLNFLSMKSLQVIDSDQVPTQRMNTVTNLSGTKQSKGLEGFPGIISPVGVCC